MFIHNEKKLNLPELKVIETNGKREYVTPEGNKYPSVTTVTGWQKRAFFAEWRRKHPEESKYALSRGNEFHKMIEVLVQTSKPNDYLNRLKKNYTRLIILLHTKLQYGQIILN